MIKTKLPPHKKAAFAFTKEKNLFPCRGNINLMLYISIRNRNDNTAILRSMRLNRLYKFLSFMNNVCLLNDKFSKLRMNFFQFVLSCCPFSVLTAFFLSIDRENIFAILDEDNYSNDVNWIFFLKGLIVLDRMDDVTHILTEVCRRYGDDFELTLIRDLIEETSNESLTYHDRQKIFDFLCSIPCTILAIFREDSPELAQECAVQEMNRYMSEVSQENGFNFVPLVVEDYGKVDIISFVNRTFPLADQCCSRHSQCVICHNTAETLPFIRILPCCSERCTDPKDKKYACQECLIGWGTQCNAEDPERRFRRGPMFSCPNCRTKTPFFPSNLNLKENYKLESTKQIIK